MQKCPIQGCGRQFDNQLTMIEHVKRRHPMQAQKVKQKTTTQMIEKQQKITEEMNKLPKMNRILQMSKQKKPLEFQRRSTSKKKQQMLNIIESNSIKAVDIISESRQLVEDNNSSRKLLKRATSSKINDEYSKINNNDKLPSLNPMKGKRLKLESLKQSALKKNINTQIPKQKILLKKSSLIQNQGQMYSTAPNFNKQSLSSKMQNIRSRSKGKNTEGLNSSRSEKQQLSISTQKKFQKKINTQNSQQIKPLIQSQKVFEQKPKIQRPIKRSVQRSLNKDNADKKFIMQDQLSESILIEKPTSANTQKGIKRFAFSQKTTMIGNSKFTKKQTPRVVAKAQMSEQNWKQRTLTFRNKNMKNFQIPEQAEVEYLFAINCQIYTIDLNNCFSIISLTLNNNNISNMSFLEQNSFGGFQNLESLYLDHNEIQNLESLPVYLKLKQLSLAFNKISGLDMLLKILIKIPSLEESDFSFNPLRKEANYKEAILSVSKNLKKLDGVVITKFDRELAGEYQKIYHEKNKIIPLSSPSPSDQKYRPNTAVSTNYMQSQTNFSSFNISEKELDKQIQILQKMIKNTKQQFQIIKQENNTLQQELHVYEKKISEQGNNNEEDSHKLYKKLCSEVEQLEMLNFMQYASQKELEELLIKKIKQNGFGMELLSAN